MNIMVCVTSQKNCDRLIDYGRNLLMDEDSNLLIIHIAHYEFSLMGKSEEGDALEYLYEKALECGANLTVVRSNNIVSTLVDMCQKNNIDQLVLGETKEMMSHNVVNGLKGKLKESMINVVPL
ncbi:MAG: universal stress protein UspA [Anaerovoracaceae bacterium]